MKWYNVDWLLNLEISDAEQWKQIESQGQEVTDEQRREHFKEYCFTEDLCILADSLSLNLLEVFEVAWDEKAPFPEKEVRSWENQGVKVGGPGCLYVKFKSGDQVYTCPIGVERTPRWYSVEGLLEAAEHWRKNESQDKVNAEYRREDLKKYYLYTDLCILASELSLDVQEIAKVAWDEGILFPEEYVEDWSVKGFHINPGCFYVVFKSSSKVCTYPLHPVLLGQKGGCLMLARHYGHRI